MYAKLEIRGTIKLLTGMHIGAANAFAAIGAIDSPIVKDPLNNNPMIPGSSLKGKLRSLLAKKYNERVSESFDDDAECITRLFGSANGKNGKKGQRSRVIFSDMALENGDKLRKMGVSGITEVKFENSINRLTAVANPRQIERSIRGSEYDLSIIYEIEDEKEVVDDLKLLFEGLKLLQYDYLGGSGSRGYGKVEILDLEVLSAVGDMTDEFEELLNTCNKLTDIVSK